MKKSLSLIPLMLVGVGAAHGQMLGVYRGTTSQNMVIQFSVVMEAGQLCVNPMGFGANVICPSGVIPGWGASFAICSPIVDRQFSVSLDPVDGAIPTYVVPGLFTSETTAQGTISFQSSHLRFPGVVNPVEAQLCDSGDVTWTAQRIGGASGPLNFESNFVITSTDKSGNTATLYRLDSN